MTKARFRKILRQEVRALKKEEKPQVGRIRMMMKALEKDELGIETFIRTGMFTSSEVFLRDFKLPEGQELDKSAQFVVYYAGGYVIWTDRSTDAKGNLIWTYSDNLGTKVGELSEVRAGINEIERYLYERA